MYCMSNTPNAGHFWESLIYCMSRFYFHCHYKFLSRLYWLCLVYYPNTNCLYNLNYCWKNCVKLNGNFKQKPIALIPYRIVLKKECIDNLVTIKVQTQTHSRYLFHYSSTWAGWCAEPWSDAITMTGLMAQTVHTLPHSV